MLQPPQATTPAQWMALALALARRGLGRVEPNPMVGAVVVRPGEGGRLDTLLGQGVHGRFGGPHAEVEALADCRSRGHDPAGAVVYVTLEPCCYHGKTPACTDALIRAGVSRVVAGVVDPSPRVSGGGLAALRAAGIDAEVGLCEAAARDLIAPFTKRVQHGLPWVIAKWAQTLDGRTATATGDSQWISGPASRRRVHELRARVDAIVVGINTVLADDPRLTCRDAPPLRTARRVVVDPRLRTPASAKLLTDGGPPVTIAASEALRPQLAAPAEALSGRGVELRWLPDRPGGGVELRPLLAHLAQHHDATNVLVEGGAGLLGSLIDQALVDEAEVFVAGKILGDERALGSVRGLLAQRIADARPARLLGVETLDNDVLLRYRLGEAGAGRPKTDAPDP